MMPDIRTPIDAYLDAVDAALLKSGAQRSQRMAIVRDLESHIEDGLREKAAGGETTLEHVSAVLATMDAPEAYGATPAAAAPAMLRVRRRIPAHIRWAAALLGTSIVGLMILGGFFSIIKLDFRRGHSASMSDFFILIVAATPIVLMLATSSLMGFAGWQQIRREPERYWGRCFAALEMMAFPVLIVCASPMLFLTVMFTLILLWVLSRLYDVRGATRKFLTSF